MLVKRVSRLESEGWLTAMTERLNREPELKRRLSESIDRYRARRDSHERIGAGDPPPGGGPDRVKCAHAHTAHELADPPNPIGALALAATGWPDCREACVRAVSGEARTGPVAE
jgi:exopolyphosphatase / guanosine-5'-triphosphate,3'-diphosphate pyrophosphatase